MTIVDKISDEKLQYDIKKQQYEKQQKYQSYHPEKLININILKANK